MSLLEKLASEATADAGVSNQTPDRVEVEQPVEEVIEVAEVTEPTPVMESTPAEARVEENIDTSNAEQGSTPETPQPKQAFFANEELQRFNEFVLKTGKSWEDFQALSRPTSELNAKELLEKYYSEKEGMTEKEINYELSNLILDEDNFDADFESEQDQLKREVALERELRKAREWREKHVQEINTLIGDTGNTYDPVELQRQAVDEYRATIYGALPEIKSFELGINGESASYIPDEEFGKNMKTVSEDFGIITNQYFDANGKVTDPKGWVDLTTWAYEPTRNAKIKFIVDEAIKRDREQRSKERRNVSPDSYQRNVPDSNSSNDDADFESWRNSRRQSPFG